ncbi:MAG: helix-turn-helix domain-containing protein [Lachnospiraceae bacterium]|nr:helix-turn-helix domain-containing protein [Lachnospiraceae bacterium]
MKKLTNEDYKNNVRIGENIRALRSYLGDSQSVFAKKIGVEETTLSMIENGKRSATVKILANISGATGVTIDSIIKNTKYDQQPSIASFLSFKLNDFCITKQDHRVRVMNHYDKYIYVQMDEWHDKIFLRCEENIEGKEMLCNVDGVYHISKVTKGYRLDSYGKRRITHSIKLVTGEAFMFSDINEIGYEGVLITDITHNGRVEGLFD